jgi:hypothetical protein
VLGGELAAFAEGQSLGAAVEDDQGAGVQTDLAEIGVELGEPVGQRVSRAGATP